MREERSLVEHTRVGAAALAALFAGGRRPLCYVASPLGFSEVGRVYYGDVYLPALREFVEPLDPWSMTEASEFVAAERDGRLHEFGVEVGHRNLEAIQRAEMLIAHLDGQEVDSGTAAEVGYAAALRKPCLGLRSDLRSAGEPGMRVNLQLEAFLVLSGGWVEPSLERLLERLRELRGAP